VLNDFRIALRQHLRQPGFASTVVSTLALTIGATTAVFSVVNTVLVRALPFASPERLVWIASVRPDNPSAPFSLPEFMDYRRQTRTLSGLAAYANWSASLAGDGVTERLTGARMSANAFDVLGVSPAAGRVLNESDDRPDAPHVVLLSFRLWQRQFGGSVDAVGRTVRINGESFVVAGVLPAQFPLPLRDVDVVTALAPDRDPLRHVRNSVNFLRVFGRVTPGADATQAQVELTAICRSLRQQFPVEYARKDAVSVVTLQEVLVGDYRQSMLLLLGAVIVVLATALANLVSLALVRANGRRGEFSMRIAIGASRLHLARQLAVDALLLAVIGSSLGWLLAAQAIAMAMLWAPPSIPRLGEVSLDGTVVMFVIAVTALVTALLTAAPLAAIPRTRVGDALRPVNRGAIGNRWNHRVRNAMVVAEISAALVLLLATIVLIQNLLRLHDLHPGVNPDGVFQARVSIPSAYRSPEDLARFYERLSDRIAASPGVEQFGVISIAPLSELLATVPFSVAGQPTAERDAPSANLRAISPGYLLAVGTRLLEGRLFSEADRSNTPRVALVSAALADRFLSGGAVGQRLLIDDNNEGPRPVEIVGVVENVRHTALDLPPALDVYIPLRQIHPDGVPMLRNNQFWMVRTRLRSHADARPSARQADSDPAAFRATFLAHLRAVDPDAAVSGTGTMRQFLDAWLGPRRFNLALFGAFALTAVLLAVSGLYGLVSYAVSQRAPEIGLRLAIGATQRDVQRMILRQAAGLGIAGAAVGLGLAGAVRPLISAMVPSTGLRAGPSTLLRAGASTGLRAGASTGLSAGQDVWINPAVVVATAALLIGVVLLAALLPARRAARIDPMLALKAQ
jgi:putative ABC transport system permease protein